MTRTIIVALASFLFGAAASNAQELWREPQKKLIHVGWCTPNSRFLKDNIKMVEEALAPYDGMLINPSAEGVKNGRRVSIMANQFFLENWKWEHEWFKADVENIKSTNFRHLKHNFLYAATSGAPDWFDDESWSVICHNFGLLARVCREAGLKGLILDTEAYPGRSPFPYSPKYGRSYQETRVKARQRGAEWISSICGEFPEIKIMPLFWFSQTRRLFEDGKDPVVSGETWHYGLMQPFINGVYDSIGPKAVIIDGWEDAYRYASKSDFDAGQAEFCKLSRKSVSPENIDKMTRQTRLAMAVYLDAHNPKYVDTHSMEILSRNPGVPPTEVLSRNISMALEACDEYAWTWDERKWWPVKMADWMEKSMLKCGEGMLWEETIPGITDAIRRGRNLRAETILSVEEKVKAGKLSNLVGNGSFDKLRAGVDGSAPSDCVSAGVANWGFWQDKAGKGSFSPCKSGFRDDSGIVARNVANGCVLQSLPAEAGKQYLVKVRMRNVGGGVGSMYVGWQDATGKWAYRNKFKYLSFDRPLENGWREASGLVEVPRGAAHLVVALGARDQLDDKDECFFDGVEVYKAD